MITYRPSTNKRNGVVCAVLLDGKIVGKIVAGLVGGGYQYVTRDGNRGDTFPTLGAVKRSLES